MRPIKKKNTHFGVLHKVFVWTVYTIKIFFRPFGSHPKGPTAPPPIQQALGDTSGIDPLEDVARIGGGCVKDVRMSGGSVRMSRGLLHPLRLIRPPMINQPTCEDVSGIGPLLRMSRGLGPC